MLTQRMDRVVGYWSGGTPMVVGIDGPASGFGNLQADDVPCLNDPATLGCLLALVREAWGDPTGSCNYIDGYDCMAWVAWFGVEHHGLTELEALVVALEAAP